VSTVWPQRVSKHCVPLNEYQHLNVFDISQSSIINDTEFRNQLQIANNEGTVSSFLVGNGCYHIEIPVP
jgi:hypothetical protein